MNINSNISMQQDINSNNSSMLSQPTPKRKGKAKIVLVGATEVGKTAIAQRYFFDYFPDTYSSNLEETYKKTLRYGQQKYQILVVDSVGLVGFSAAPNNLHRTSIVLFFRINLATAYKATCLFFQLPARNHLKSYT